MGPRYKSGAVYFIGVSCASEKNCRFQIHASCLQVAESEVINSTAMEHASANIDKIQAIYSRLRPHADDDGDDGEIDEIGADLEAELLSAGLVSLGHKKIIDKDDEDDGSEVDNDMFSDVSSVDSLPSDLKNRLLEFSS